MVGHWSGFSSSCWTIVEVKKAKVQEYEKAEIDDLDVRFRELI